MAAVDGREHTERLRAWLDAHAADAPRRTVLAPLDEAAIRAPPGVAAAAGRRRVSRRHLAGALRRRRRRAGAADHRRARARCPRPVRRLDFVGLDMVAPTLIDCGSPEQRERYLRPPLRAGELWGRLLSEPGAGSDLAAVQTRARRRRDGWRAPTRKSPSTRLTMFAVPIGSDGGAGHFSTPIGDLLAAAVRHRAHVRLAGRRRADGAARHR